MHDSFSFVTDLIRVMFTRIDLQICFDCANEINGKKKDQKIEHSHVSDQKIELASAFEQS